MHLLHQPFLSTEALIGELPTDFGFSGPAHQSSNDADEKKKRSAAD